MLMRALRELYPKASSHPAAGIIKGRALAANSHDPAPKEFRGKKNLGRKHARYDVRAQTSVLSRR